MKIYKYLIGLISLSILSACSDWLDLQPQDTTEDDQLFETGTGFRNALNGVYRQMAGSSMYGKALTWGALDAMANYYSPSQGSNEYYFAGYQYTGTYAYPVIQSFWSDTYNCIANCNNLIQRTQKEPVTTFTKGDDEKNMILGEALALRAILHFDMMRLFAPADMKDPVAYIPFVETYPCTFQEYVTNDELSKKVIADLKQAKELLAKFDVPRISWMLSDMRWKNNYQRLTPEEEAPDDLFFSYRGYRLNYYAICGMLARVYLYKGMYKEAFDETEIVVNAESKPQQEYLFSFTNSSDMTDGNSKLYDEILFGLSNQKLEENYRNYRLNSSGDELYLSASYWYVLDDWFANDANDIRYKLLVAENYHHYSSKYLPNEGSNKQYATDIIPMLRLGEMHYIRAEYYNHLYQAKNLTEDEKKTLNDKILEEFAIVRRGHDCSKEFVDNTGDKWFNKELLNEARREFMGEGQLFFYYKRLGITVPGMKDAKKFVLPYPLNEAL